jgi:dTDP-4-amino-4,6-dideoxygalactose transaminase
MQLTSRPLLSKYKELVNLFKQIDNNRWYSNYGPLYRKTQKKIEKHFNLKHNNAILTSSGHSSLLACCSVLRKYTKKKYIILPSYSFYSNPQSIIQAGFDPLFVDINLTDFSIDQKQLELLIKRYKNKIAAIMFVSPYGFPINIKDLNNIQKKHQIFIIYDAADTFINLPKKLDYSRILITCSFHPTKSLPANESGLIIAPKKYLVDFENILNFGFEKINRNLYLNGFNGKFSEYDAAIFLANFKRLKIIKKELRKKNFYISNKLSKIGNLYFNKEMGKNWITSKIFLLSKTKNFKKLEKEFTKKNVRIFKPWSKRPMHEEKIFKKYKKMDLKNTKTIHNYGFAIPFYIDQSLKEINLMIKKINQIF